MSLQNSLYMLNNYCTDEDCSNCNATKEACAIVSRLTEKNISDICNLYKEIEKMGKLETETTVKDILNGVEVRVIHELIKGYLYVVRNPFNETYYIQSADNLEESEQVEDD